MPAKLDFYSYDLTTKVSTPLNGTFSLGNIFKGSLGIGTLRLYNSGNKKAINPILKISSYNDNLEILPWKGISFSHDYDFSNQLTLEDIEPGSFAIGKDIYFEDFSNYNFQSAQPIVGENWSTWHNTNSIDPWYAYSKSLYYYGVDPRFSNLPQNTDTTSIITPSSKILGAAKDFTISATMSCLKNSYIGWIFRDNYIVTVSGIREDFKEDIYQLGHQYALQIWYGDPKKNKSWWTPLEDFDLGNSVNGTKIWIELTDQTLGEQTLPVFKIWTDTDDISKDPTFIYVLEQDKVKTCYSDISSIPKIIGYEPISENMSNMVIDDIKMIVKNQSGIIYLKSTVPSDTKLSGTQYFLLDIDYGSEE